MSGRWHRTVQVVMVLAALSAARLITATFPDEDHADRPFIRRAALGERVPLRIGDVTVTSVEGGHELGTVLAGYRTPGLWVMAHFSVVPRTTQATITGAELRDVRGRVWNTLFRNQISCMSAPPGLTSHCVLAIEVPPDALPGAQLALLPNSTDPRHDDQAVIDLGITPQQVATWQANRTMLELKLSTVVER